MCLIIVSPPGTVPDFDNLTESTWDNPDGAGWAMRTPNGLEVMRSATQVDKVLDGFLDARDAYPNAWAVWHARLATQGRNLDENTHPFAVPGRPWVMAHNGVLPLNDGPFDKRDRSDSRILAEDILSEADWDTLLRERYRIENWLYGDKVVILSERKERGGPCLILGEEHGMWDAADGCWYSRHSRPARCDTCRQTWGRCTCHRWGDYRVTYVDGKAAVVESANADDEDYVDWWAAQDLAERSALAEEASA